MADDECDEVIYDDTDLVLVTDKDLDVSVVTDESLVVVSDCVGVPGAQGPAGPPGEGGGGSGERIEFSVEAGLDLQAFRLVVPRMLEANVRHADPTFLPHSNRPLWITLHAALEGEMVQVVGEGMITNLGWSWTQDPIYLGPDGTLTQTVPTAPSAAFATQVGYPISPTTMYLSPTPAIELA